MTHSSIPQVAARARSARLYELAGTPRCQAKIYKRLLRDLRQYEREAIRSVAKVQKLLAAATSANLEALCANRRRAPAPLINAFYLPDLLDQRVSDVRGCIAELVGATNDYETEVRLWNRPTTVDEANEAKPAALEQAQHRTLSPDDALSEAMQIVSNAHDDTLEIDWSETPGSDRERDLRLAIIRNIETKRAEDEAKVHRYFGSDGTSHVAFYTRNALDRLAPADAEEVGDDLCDALERWEAECEKEDERNAAITRKNLLDAARRDLDGQRVAGPRAT